MLYCVSVGNEERREAEEKGGILGDVIFAIPSIRLLILILFFFITNIMLNQLTVPLLK